MVFQIMIRASSHLAISQLEVSILAFACCAIVIYVLDWGKPKGVQVQIVLIRYQGQIPDLVFSGLPYRIHRSATKTPSDASIQHRYPVQNKAIDQIDIHLLFSGKAPLL